MEVLKFAELDSTSTHAMQLLRDGKQAPFAVLADSQKSGRGRHGRTWESPKGGLYLSLVLPALSHDPQLVGKHAIVAAMILSDFIYENLQTRLTIKWPNDLLWQGRKVVGVLGEVGPQHSIVMGVGINVNASIKATGDLNAISLSEIVGRQIDLGKFADALVEFWETKWNLKVWETAAADFSLDAQIDFWQHEKEILVSKGLDASGALLTQAVGESKAKSHVSVEHGLSPVIAWHNPSIIYIDVGNTSVKWATRKSGEDDFDVGHVVLVNENWEKDFADQFKILREKRYIAAGYLMSVNPEIAAKVEKILSDLPLVPIKKQWRNVRSQYSREQIGIDRMAVIEAVAAKKIPQSFMATMIVSMGTAMTIDILTPGRLHRGGYIVPGIFLTAKSMNKRLAMLPELQWEQLQKANLELGTNTEDAMTHGVLQMARATILQTGIALAEQLATEPEHIRVVLSGGGAELMKKWLPHADKDSSALWRGMEILAT